MAELVGLASGIAGLAQLTLMLSEAIYAYTSSLRQKQKTIQELVDELALLGEVLTDLQPLLQSEEEDGRNFDKDAVLQHAIRGCKRRIERIGERLRIPTDGGRLERAWNNMVWPFEQKEILQMTDNLRRYVNIFQFALTAKGYTAVTETSSKAMARMTDMLNKMNNSRIKDRENIQGIIDFLPNLLRQEDEVKEINQTLKAAEEREQQRRKQEILDWLVEESNLQKHLNVQQRCTADTGQWFLQSPTFLEWVQDLTMQDMVCVGGPGTGKTVLCSLVIDFLRKKFDDSDSAVVYYYCDFSEQQVQNASHLQRCILRQLVQYATVVPAMVSDFYSRTKTHSQDSVWLHELQAVLQRVIATYRQCVLVIDALDETEIREQRPSLLRVLQTMCVRSGNLRIFATTRPHAADIERHFEGSALKYPIAANIHDLRLFLNKRIDDHPYSRDIMDPGLRNDIIARLCANADGMFLLPALQIDTILDSVTKGDVKRALQNLSKTLPEVFRSTLQRIRSFVPHRRDLAMKTLMWISRVRRPLLVSELQHALAIDVDQSDFDQDDVPEIRPLLDSCCGLVELDGEDATGEGPNIRFVHYSLYEFLQFEDHDFFSQGDLIITKSCLRYLSYDNIRSQQNESRNDIVGAILAYPFLHYASLYWGFHAAQLEIDRYQDLAFSVLEDKRTLFLTARVRDINTPDIQQWKTRTEDLMNSGSGGLFLAAGFGLAQLVQALLQNKPAINLHVHDGYGGTPLHECAVNGSIETAKILISHGANVLELNKGNATAFYLAVSYNHLDMCKMLHNHDKKQINTACKDDRTPLHKACDIGDVAMVQFLMDSGADLEATTSKRTYRMTPLHFACRRGHVPTARLLLDAGAEVEARSTDGMTALDFAALGGHLELIQILFERNGRKITGTRRGWTALHRAARAGHSEVVKFLLQNGADPLVTDNKGETPLMLAIKSDDEECVDAILEHDKTKMLQQLQRADKDGQSTKIVALFTGRYNIYKRLRDLENSLLGRDPALSNITDPVFALTRAIEQRDYKEVRKILDFRPELAHMRGPLNLTALHIAFLEEDREMATEVLERGVPIDIQGFHGWSPLHIAAASGSLRMLSLALTYEANVHARTETLQTPLHKAVSSYSLPCVVELLKCGADPTAQNDRKMTALHVAAHRNFMAGVKELLKTDAQISSINRTPSIPLVLRRDSSGHAARWWANNGGFLELATYLSRQEKLAYNDIQARRRSNTLPHKSSPSLTGSEIDTAPSTPITRTTTRESISRQSSEMSSSFLSPSTASLSRSTHLRRTSTDSLVSLEEADNALNEWYSPSRSPLLENSFSGIPRDELILRLERRRIDLALFEIDSD